MLLVVDTMARDEIYGKDKCTQSERSISDEECVWAVRRRLLMRGGKLMRLAKEAKISQS